MSIVDQLSEPWDVGSFSGRIECTTIAWEEITSFVMAGFRASPWGGPEVGGLLFGLRTPGQIRVWGWCEIPCEHANGPRFELSEKDQAGLQQLIAARPAGADVVGWFQSRFWDVGWSQSTSRGLYMAPLDTGLHKRYFPEPWQVALMVQRAKSGPLTAGFFFRQSDGSMDLMTREFGDRAPDGTAPPITGAARSPAMPGKTPGTVAPSPQHFESESRTETADRSIEAKPGAVPATVEPPFEEPRVVPGYGMPQETVSIGITPGTASIRHGSDEPGTYWTLFGLKYNPFARSADPKSIYWSQQHRAILTKLCHGIVRGNGIAVLSGPVGTGKTVLLDTLGLCLKKAAIQFALIRDSHLTIDQLYDILNYDLALNVRSHSRPAVLSELAELVTANQNGHHTAALLVDGAHNLSRDVMEEIRFLDNLNFQNTKVLQIVLVGQRALETKLEAPEFRALKQRITARHVLAALDERDTSDFISEKMMKAGLENQDVFPLDVVRQIHSLAQGIPRMIDAFCDELLKACAAARCKTATLELVNEIRPQILVLPAVNSALQTESNSRPLQPGRSGRTGQFVP